MRAILYRHDGTFTVLDITGLPDLQKAVGGYIEPIKNNGPIDVDIFVNEEGIDRELPLNPWWRRLCLSLQMLLPPLFGNILVACHDPDGELRDVSEAVINKLPTYL